MSLTSIVLFTLSIIFFGLSLISIVAGLEPTHTCEGTVEGTNAYNLAKKRQEKAAKKRIVCFVLAVIFFVLALLLM